MNSLLTSGYCFCLPLLWVVNQGQRFFRYVDSTLKNPKNLKPGLKVSGSSSKPPFFRGELSVKLQGSILQPHIHATRTRHFFFECSWSCDRSGDRELQRCCWFFLKRERLSFSLFWGVWGGHFFQKSPLQSPHVLSCFHLLGLAVWGSLIHRNVTGWFPPEKIYVTIKKAPKRSLWSKSPLVNLHHVSYFVSEEKKSHLESHWWKDLCAKKVHPWDIIGQEVVQKSYGSPAPAVGEKISAASVVHQSCCNGSGVSRFLGCVLLTPPWSLCLARKSMEVVSTCKHEAKKNSFFVFASIWSFVHLLKRHMFQAR